MSDIIGDVPPTPRLFGAANTPPEQTTPVVAGSVHSEILPDETADYADVQPTETEVLNAIEDPIVTGPGESLIETVAEARSEAAPAGEAEPERSEGEEPEVLTGDAEGSQETATAWVDPAPSIDGQHVDDATFPDAPAAAIGGDTPPEVANAEAGIVPATTSNLDELSVEELKKQEELLKAKIEQKKAEEKKAVIDQIVNVVKQFEISTEELVEALGGLKIKRKGVKAKAKYRDPVTGITWSGRGKEPVWLRGKDKNQFLVVEAAE